MAQYKGKGVSRGVAIGEVLVYRPFSPVLDERCDYSPALDKITDFIKALAMAESEYARMLAPTIGQKNDDAAILAAHVEILRDPEIYGEIRDLLEKEPTSAALAVARVFDGFAETLSSLDDELIRERSTDVIDVRNRILRILAGLPEQNLSRLDGPRVIVARDLMPSDAVILDRDMTAAIVTEIGGETSHTAIIARGYGIPALVGVENVTEILRDGEEVIVDAIDGVLYTEAAEDAVSIFAEKSAEYRRRVEASRAYIRRDAATTVGVRVEVGVNIQNVSDDLETLADVSDSVGLFRTEFMFMERSVPPTEDEQCEAYKRVLSAFAGKYVILRTIDIGGDKDYPAFNLPREDNPFLGLRAIRLCLAKQDIFRTQLRAAFRASVAGNLWIMLPMVNGMDDIRRAKTIIGEVKRELASEGIPFSSDVKTGIMIEVPSIAIIADIAAAEVDFASIGSNDLCQYTLAVDRMNPGVSEYYEPFRPSLFRLMKFVIDEFTKRGKPIGICGEMGGDPMAAAVLLGLGIRQLSAGPDMLPRLKEFICTHSLAEMEECARPVLDLPTSAEIKEFLERRMKF